MSENKNQSVKEYVTAAELYYIGEVYPEFITVEAAKSVFEMIYDKSYWEMAAMNLNRMIAEKEKMKHRLTKQLKREIKLLKKENRKLDE